MTEQRTEESRDVLEELAKSHGLFGAEDLAEQAHEADPTYSVRDILENPQAGFGEALNLVPGMSEEERTRVSGAFARMFLGSAVARTPTEGAGVLRGSGPFVLFAVVCPEDGG